MSPVHVKLRELELASCSILPDPIVRQSPPLALVPFS